MNDCGGCQGIGKHKRWCKAEVGIMASHYGPMATQLKYMGDSVGPNNMALSNSLWSLSARMKEWAQSLSATYQEQHAPLASHEHTPSEGYAQTQES